MNIFPLEHPRAAGETRMIKRTKGDQKGIALVLVLGFLVLISALIISFFSSVQTDLQSARSYSDSVTGKQLAEMATAIVQGQISDGTRSYDVAVTTDTPAAQRGSALRLTWASQPGMIRTFDENGRIHRSFKLFSNARMVEAANEDYIPAKESQKEIDDEWYAKPSLYTDLNSPVLVPDSTGKITKGGKTYYANYPILDPLALGQVEGFDLGKDGAGATVAIPDTRKR
jgi:hypothetical protein